MVSILTWLLAGLVLYTLVAMFLRDRGLLPASVKVSGPVTTIHTRRGRALLDWLARPRRFWRAWGNLGLGVAVVVMVGSFLMVAFSVAATLERPEPTALTQPQNALVIPGVNEFLPLAAAPYIVAGLVIGLVVHEGGHGLMCRVGDIDIESMGLVFLTVVPMGAFVEPDEESQRAADRGPTTRMFAAGVTNNFAVALLGFLLLFGPVAGSLAVVQGAHVSGTLSGGPAATAGIQPGDVITAVDGSPVGSDDALGPALADATGPVTEVTLQEGGTVDVRRTLVVEEAPPDSPVPLNSTVTAVNGTAVYTEAGLLAAIADREVARLSTSAGTVTLPMGALALVTPGGPLSTQGPPANASVVLTRIDGERVRSRAELADVLDATRGGETVAVVAYRNGTRETYEVTLGTAEDGTGLLGVRLPAGTTGLGFDDFGAKLYPADYILGALAGAGDGGLAAVGFLRRVLIALLLPFLGAATGAGVNFAGFIGVSTNFFTAAGPLAFLGTGGVFALANLLFWTAWVNLVIGQFNCVPMFPLDGGHILRTSTEAIVARLPVSNRQALTKVVTVTVGLSMIGGLLFVIFGPQLLS